MALYRSPLTVTLWPSSFLKKYGPMIPPAHKAHQTVRGPYAKVGSTRDLKERRFVLGTFRSERMRILCRSRQNDRLGVMLVLVHKDITPPYTALPMLWRIGERTIPHSWRAYQVENERGPGPEPSWSMPSDVPDCPPPM
ncbi:uncharacterized protein TNCV_1192691 [Trichonephila clavipes]|nr:uncharacterized protein TNCV_1192691 [Trichonephila clavipes]